jgi:hypothetical protein
VVGGSAFGGREVAAAFQAVHQAVRPTPCDVVAVACGARLLRSALPVFGSRVLLGRGVDGADKCLLEYLCPDRVVGKFASVTLASGDGAAFAAPVRRLAAQGVPTDLVLGAGCVGADLYRAARSVVRAQQFALAA